jgi:hypothetical protein
MWQMQEEEDRRDATRKDIRIEYERQRLMDLEAWAEQSVGNRQYHSDSSIQDDQRRKLLSRKLVTSNNSRREAGKQERDAVSVSGRAEAWAEQSVVNRRYHSESSIQDDRRRKLLSCKLDASNNSRREAGKQERDAASVSGTSVASNQAVMHPVGVPIKPVGATTRILRAHTSPRSKRDERRLGQLKAATVAASDMSSLFMFDDDGSDDEDELLSLVDVALH